MNGILIVIEGLDGSGKETQTGLLAESLESMGIPCRRVSFPDYESDSSALVKMYLKGELGGSPSDVNPYAASSFYAVDRFVSFSRDWKSDYETGTVIIADRYATSNLIYQLSKVSDTEKEDFISWAVDYEYVKLGLPEPSAVLYLDMNPQVSQKLMSRRYSGDESKKDIHERNVAFLEECRESALFSAEKLEWNVIPCDDGDEPRAIEDIHRDVLNSVLDTIKQKGVRL